MAQCRVRFKATKAGGRHRRVTTSTCKSLSGPADGRFVLPDLEASSAGWLDAKIDAALSLSREGDVLVLRGPSAMPNEHVTVIRFGKVA